MNEVISPTHKFEIFLDYLEARIEYFIEVFLVELICGEGSSLLRRQ